MKCFNSVMIRMLSGILLYSLFFSLAAQTRYFVATDGSEILVNPGECYGRIRLRGTFKEGVTVKSELPYHIRLLHYLLVLHALEVKPFRGCSKEDDYFYTGSQGVAINRNIFLNWEESSGSNFVLIGENGKALPWGEVKVNKRGKHVSV